MSSQHLDSKKTFALKMLNLLLLPSPQLIANLNFGYSDGSVGDAKECAAKRGNPRTDLSAYSITTLFWIRSQKVDFCFIISLQLFRSYLSEFDICKFCE